MVITKKTKFLIKLSKYFFALAVFLLSQKTHAAINVPLTVQEALPAGVSGLDRNQEPVTVGIPLAQDANITNVNQLGLSGTSTGQFRPLAWWPNGNIKWVLADFETDVAANLTNTNISLTDGSGNFGGSNLATDNADNISINTGNAQFVIKKNNFNVFDSVSVEGQQLVTSGNSGSVNAVGLDDTQYSSLNDSNVSVSIQENGPVKSVIKITGSLKSANKTRLMEYILRLYFYKGKSYVKANLILSNANQSYLNHIGFKSAQITVPVSLGTNKNILFSRKNDTVGGLLPSGKTAYLYQGQNNSYAIYDVNNCYPWTPPAPGTCSSNVFTYDSAFQGLNIELDTVQLNNPGNVLDWSQGWASMNDSGNVGITTAYRYLSANWPGGFEFKDNGEVNIELFSKYNNETPLKLAFGSHEGRELLWDFHIQAVDDKAKFYALQYPLIARAPFEGYISSKVLWGQSEFVKQLDEQTFFSQVGIVAAPSFANPAQTQYFREWYWPSTGGWNQTDAALDQLTDFLRSGNSGSFVNADQRSTYNSDAAIPHTNVYGKTLAVDPLPTVKSLNGGMVDFEHSNLNVLSLNYFMSGNEAYKESYLDYGNYLNDTQAKGYYASSPSIYARAQYRRLRNMALLYEFSNEINAINQTFINTVTTAINAILDSRDVPGQNNSTQNATVGRNLQRGYIFQDRSICITPGSSSQTCSGSNYGRDLHSFFYTMIGFEAFWQIHRVMNDLDFNYSRMQELEDFMTGESQFFYKEYIDPDGNKFGWDYDYPLDVPHSTPFNLSHYPSSRAALWAYQHTGDAQILNKGAAIVQGLNGDFSPSEFQDQALIWSYLNKSSIPVWQNINVNVVDNGGGSYTLSWTVPQGATKYQIKYDDKIIVDWLGYDKTTGVFQYDPANYTAFFAANNITNNPTPQTAGTIQSITLTGLPLNQNFSIKALTNVPKKYFFVDFTNIFSKWFKTDTQSDINSDGKVNAKDLGIMMSRWN